MTHVVTYVILIILGLVFGSFAGATVWRLRARQLKVDKAAGEPYDKHEYKQLQAMATHSVADDRSQCLHCGYQLRWYDLIPLASWIALRGKCRSCHHRIGYFEPLIELGVAAFFVLSFVFWPDQLNNTVEVARFVVWLAAGVGLSMLFSYDIKWTLLPDRVNYTVIGLGIINVILLLIGSNNVGGDLANVAGAILLLSGLYLMLYLISKGRWIGFGDVKLGLGLALLLTDWQLAFIALFAANLIGCLYVIPGLLSGKLSRQAHIPFGPLLILGLIFAQFFGSYLIQLYLINLS